VRCSNPLPARAGRGCRLTECEHGDDPMGVASASEQAQQQSDLVVLPDGRIGQLITVAPYDPRPLPRVPNPPAPPTHVRLVGCAT
jgi:hypothetical protein